MGWNPANWKITDTLQGQDGGYNKYDILTTAAKLNPITGAAVNTGQGVTKVLGATSGTATAPNYTENTYQAPASGQTASADAWNSFINQNTGTGTGTGSTGTTTAPKYSQADLDALNEQERLYRALFGSADATLNSGISNLDNTLAGERNKANTSYGRATAGYDQKEYDTKMGMQGQMRGAMTNSGMLADSVRRILGMAGAAGGTAMRDAYGAVAKDMKGKENALMGDYGQNIGLLKKARDETQVDYDSLLSELQNQRQTGEQNLRAGILGQKQGLQRSLDEIAQERQRLMGGNQLSGLQSMTNNYLKYQSDIDALPGQYANTIKARDVKAAPVSLKDYFVGQTNLGQNQRSGNYSPYSDFLAKRKPEEEEQKPLTY
jgi:hypothetical protein